METTDSTEKTGRKKNIDQVDSRIIRLLQKDGRLTNIQIAKKLEISEATVRTRLKRLIEEDFIQIVAVSNPFKLGFEITGDLYIHVDIKKIDEVTKALKKIKALWYIVISTGDASINAEFVVKNREDLNDLIFNNISKIDGVVSIETSIILKFAKRKYDFGTAFD